MKFEKLSPRRKNLVNDSAKLSVDKDDNVVYFVTGVTVPDEILLNFFKFSNM